MKKQNKDVTFIVQALDALGYNVDSIDLKVTGPERETYIEACINISRLDYPPDVQPAGQSE